MTNKSIIPSLLNQLTATQEALHNFVTQEPRISQASSWYVKYDCDINCSEELKESLRLNVTFDNHSYGTYVSKSHSLNQAMNDLEKYYIDWIKENDKKQAQAKKDKRDREILQLIQQGKVQEAAQLSATPL